MNTSTTSRTTPRRLARRPLRRGLVLAVAGALALAACGSDSDSDADDASSDSVAGTEAPDATTADTTETSGTAGRSEAAFPVTIEHVFGETTIESEPQRVVSIGYAEHESILALGVTPIAVRDWYGDQPFATWPWAQDELGDAEPEVLPSTELNFEQIAALEPDLIIGVSSGIEEGDYETLSQIAPTVTRTGEQLYGTPWREQLEIIGRALGKSDVAEQVIADTDEKFAAVREEHPEFEGLEAAVSFAFEGEPGAYASEDSRAQILAEFGFVTPAEFDELSGDQFYFTVSPEELSVIDRDVIVWLASDETSYEAMSSMTLRPTLTAYAEGREVIADPLLAGAFSHASPLSIEFVIDELVPELALAVDGDPATAVPSMAVLGGATESGEYDEDQQAAADAWSLVFDSAVGFDAKAEHLDDAAALQPTVEAYTEAGSAMGGITLVPTAVSVAGDQATITYDVMFGEETAYTALEGEISLVDGVWVVSRDEFCSFMASARNACPA